MGKFEKHWCNTYIYIIQIYTQTQSYIEQLIHVVWSSHPSPRNFKRLVTQYNQALSDCENIQEQVWPMFTEWFKLQTSTTCGLASLFWRCSRECIALEQLESEIERRFHTALARESVQDQLQFVYYGCIKTKLSTALYDQSQHSVKIERILSYDSLEFP